MVSSSNCSQHPSEGAREGPGGLEDGPETSGRGGRPFRGEVALERKPPTVISRS